MNINSNYKDFYDYVIGIVGVDTERHYYRVAKEWEGYSNKEDRDDNNKKLNRTISSYLSICRMNRPSVGNFLQTGFVSRNLEAIVSEFAGRYGFSVEIHNAYIFFGTRVTFALCLTTGHLHNKEFKNTYTPIASLNCLKGLLSDKTIFERDVYSDYEGALKNVLSAIDDYRDALIERGVDPADAEMIGTVANLEDDPKGLVNILEYNKMVGAPVSMFVSNSSYHERREGIQGTIVTNPMLRGSGIEIVVDPMEAYQNIEMALTSISNVEKEVNFTDDVMIESKGFDTKVSFRNRSKKKK